MKRKCKNADITDITFIKDAIKACMARKLHQRGYRIYNRADVKSYFEYHHNDIDSIAKELQAEILGRHLILEPVHYKTVIDKSNGKERLLCVEHIKQQFYDYIATNALSDLDSYIGVHQTACKIGKGQQYSARLVKRWLNTEDISYCIKADIRKCYQSITHENIMLWLRKHVKNEPLLWLIGELLNNCEEGLPIGSYMSIKLCALYLADIYHHIENDYIYEKRGERRNAVNKVLIYLDDIYIFGSNATQLKRVIRGTIDYAKSKGLEIKPDYKFVSLKAMDENAHVDVVGYKVYRDRITARRSNYLKLKRSIRKFKHSPNNVSYALSTVARLGLFLNHTNCTRFVRKYRIKKLRKSARKVVSEYAKSDFRQKTESGHQNG